MSGAINDTEDGDSLTSAATHWDSGAIPPPKPLPRPWCTQSFVAAIIGIIIGGSCMAAAQKEVVPLFTFYAEIRTLHPTGTFVGSIEIGYLASLVLLASSIRLLIVSIINGRYIGIGATVIIRSVETCITRPVVYALLAAICGVVDVHLLVMLAFLGIVTSACGLAMDVYSNIALGRTGETINGFIGFVAVLFFWCELFLHLTHMPSLPFVRFIAASQFIGSLVIPALQLVRFCSSKLTRAKFENAMNWTLTVCNSLLAISVTAGIIATHNGYV